ncbi:MAG TPA: pyridoxamine 5'-phosphate oxidase [Chromatiales bacterium]|nr:pyridoxamine 5'-phosphate oxidase [Chromatiales bacterium]
MSDLYEEALRRFSELLEEAKKTELPEPTAMTLATATPEGRPSVRTVLLKHHDARGFVFYTNLNSRKARQLRDNPHAALCFYWQPLARQVLIEGTAELVDSEEADRYWATRPRDSQIGAWASLQSEPLESRAVLERRVEETRARFRDRNVPRPPQWGGYRVVPRRIEFWAAGWHRLHERICYEQTGSGRWHRRLLYP